MAFVVRLVSSLKIEKERGRNPSTFVGYHTVVVDPFNSEGYNNLVARKLKGYIALWLES